MPDGVTSLKESSSPAEHPSFLKAAPRVQSARSPRSSGSLLTSSLLRSPSSGILHMETSPCLLSLHTCLGRPRDMLGGVRKAAVRQGPPGSRSNGRLAHITTVCGVCTWGRGRDSTWDWERLVCEPASSSQSRCIPGGDPSLHINPESPELCHPETQLPAEGHGAWGHRWHVDQSFVLFRDLTLISHCSSGHGCDPSPGRRRLRADGRLLGVKAALCCWGPSRLLLFQSSKHREYRIVSLLSTPLLHVCVYAPAARRVGLHLVNVHTRTCAVRAILHCALPSRSRPSVPPTPGKPWLVSTDGHAGSRFAVTAVPEVTAPWTPRPAPLRPDGSLEHTRSAFSGPGSPRTLGAGRSHAARPT
uniref:Uncharacterized protein n=1 Tax=Rangifer tarandus platyrhynchus TaxID=3082113 RepID=A0ACB0FH80_RANTA|nr:unnamed protein product [Rangifer tarandus platyrhynchus]